MKTVGIEDYTYGHWKHKLMAYLAKCIKNIIGDNLYLTITFESLKDFRQKYYKTNNLSEN